jgi:hypothetical protein
MIAPLETQGAVVAKRQSGGIDPGDHMIADLLACLSAWSADDIEGVTAGNSFYAQSWTVASTTPVTNGDNVSGGQLSITNGTDVTVKIEFGLSESPSVVNTAYGFLYISAGRTVNALVPGKRISVAKVTALSTPGASAAVVVNFENTATAV